MTESERDLYGQLQSEMESCATQIGRKSEQLRVLDDEILVMKQRISENWIRN